MMRTISFAVSALLALVFAFAADRAADMQAEGPKLLSLFPSAGMRGATIQAEVRGNLIEGAYAVWFDDEGLSGRILKTEEVREAPPGDDSATEASKNPPRVYRVSIEVKVGPTTGLGSHSLRLVSPSGLSNAQSFRVLDEPVVLEATRTHESAKQAQPVTLPALINGRLEKPGELDYYSFEAKKGQEVSLHVVLAENFDAHLALYRMDESWFDSDRPMRVLLEEERSSDLMPVKAQGTFRVPEDGQYFLEVSSIFGKGSPDCSYQLRIALKGARRMADDARPEAKWQERSFSRKLQPDWTATLVSRSAHAPHSPAEPSAKASDPSGESAAVTKAETAEIPAVRASVLIIKEREPNDRTAEALDVSIPVVIEGGIERPGDIDNFKFKVDRGEKLAFEVETPEIQPPLFNPRLAVIDSQDRELFSNVHWRVSVFNNNADRQVYLKGLEPKAVYTFEREGAYVLQIRDITSRYGGPGYRYRILVRPQVPHVGEVSVKEGDHINLVRGQTSKLIITTSQEEGFTGDVLFLFTGLPEGVQAFAGTEVNDDRAPTDIDEKADAVAPKTQKTTILLLAAHEALLTSMPKIVHLHCRPIADGHPGSLVLVRDIPLMVVDASQPKPTATQPSKR